MDYTGKVVIVTGASSGIGAATAKLYASYGALIAAVGRNETRLNDVANVCESYKGNRPLCILLDLLVPGSCEELVKRTVQTYGKIDILVNCAGKAAVTSLFDNSMEIFDELFALNLRVPYRLTQLCLPYLKRTKGNVVNIFGSPSRVRPGFIPYAMIKEALEKFTTAGSTELASEGVRMNAVRPGLTRTNFLSNFNVDDDCMDMTYKLIQDTLPNKVINEPEEVAKLILFVTSDTCPNLNGAHIVLDGASSTS